MGLELIPAEKRTLPVVDTQEIFRLPLNDGELKMLIDIFLEIRKQNADWAKDPLVDRLYTKVSFLFFLGRVIFLPPAESKPFLEGVLKLHGILAEQVMDLKRVEAEIRAAGQQQAKPAPEKGSEKGSEKAAPGRLRPPPAPPAEAEPGDPKGEAK